MNAAELAAQVPPPQPGEVLAVVGPTASGKTELAVELARRFDGEIIGADSVQIYRHFDIGSGKPSADERAAAPYHLVDFADPMTPLNAGEFAALAAREIEAIRERGRLPIVCGGSYLWVKATLEGLIEVAPSSPSIRKRHTEEAERLGRAELHRQLAAVDPVSAGRIDPNNLVRVSRALEVFELTGERISDLQARHQASGHRYPSRRVAVRWERTALNERVALRTGRWLDGGWLDEVERLRAAGYAASRAMGSVGYRQALDHLEGRLARDLLAEAINQATRVFIRRQMTWLRDEPVLWLDARP